MTEEVNSTEGTETVPPNETFESWFEKQDESVKGLITGHTQGLSNTVKAVREERDVLSKQIKDLTAKAEAGSETQKQLEKLSKELEAANRRSDFVESASREKCNNVKAAYALAQAEDLFRRDGSPDWVKIREEAPQLFEQKGNPRSGDGKTAPAGRVVGSEMDEIIRNAFGG